MIDTIGFKVLISRELYDKCLNLAITTQRMDNSTGEIEFEYHNAKLGIDNPSWNYKVHIKITEEYWAYDERSKRPYIACGIPHIRLEYSVPKVLFGNNLISVDPDLIYESMQKVKESFEREFGIELPSPNDWYCYRIDTCANFILESPIQVKKIITYLQRLDYPRKSKHTYEDTGIYFPSKTSTLKIYWKGPEFKKHDFNRLKNNDNVSELLDSAQNILRTEVEHRKRLLYMIKKHESENSVKFEKFEGYIRMVDLMEIFNFMEEMENYMSKILCGTKSKVMKTNDPIVLLQSRYSERQSRSFHHIYIVIVMQGQKEAKRIFSEGTYYRALRAFRELGISLILSDDTEEGVFLDHSIPPDFSLKMNEDNKYYQQPIAEMNYLKDINEGDPF